MSDKFASRAALRDKIDWEGGTLASLEYGIKTADMPEGDTELTEAWTKLEAAYRDLAPLVDAVDKLLEAADDEGTE